MECPACPQPGQNLPDGWEKAGPLAYVLSSSYLCLLFALTLFVLTLFVLTLCFDPLFRFLYALYITVDANFKLRGKE